jgi:hypothetical protein
MTLILMQVKIISIITVTMVERMIMVMIFMIKGMMMVMMMMMTVVLIIINEVNNNCDELPVTPCVHRVLAYLF